MQSSYDSTTKEIIANKFSEKVWEYTKWTKIRKVFVKRIQICFVRASFLRSDFLVLRVSFCLHQNNKFEWCIVKQCDQEQLSHIGWALTLEPNGNRSYSTKWIHSEQWPKLGDEMSSFFQKNSNNYSNINSNENDIHSGQGESQPMQSQRVWSRSSRVMGQESQKSRKPENQKSKTPVTFPVNSGKKISQQASEPLSQIQGNIIQKWTKLCTYRRYVYKRPVKSFF